MMIVSQITLSTFVGDFIIKGLQEIVFMKSFAAALVQTVEEQVRQRMSLP